jgi:hypothetical protein
MTMYPIFLLFIGRLPIYTDLALSLAFSPVPLIRTFETVVDRLIAIRKDLQQRTEQMERSVRQGEREFSTRMKGLNDNFEVCIGRFAKPPF